MRTILSDPGEFTDPMNLEYKIVLKNLHNQKSSNESEENELNLFKKPEYNIKFTQIKKDRKRNLNENTYIDEMLLDSEKNSSNIINNFDSNIFNFKSNTNFKENFTYL